MSEVRQVSLDDLMRVLDRNFAQAGIQITARRYNKILTELGFSLREPSDAPPRFRRCIRWGKGGWRCPHECLPGSLFCKLHSAE